jgi:hypothetical protein
MLLKILTALFAALVMVVGAGCTIHLQDEGSVKLTFGTTIGVESTSSTTNSKSEASFKPQSFAAWIVEDDDDATE